MDHNKHIPRGMYLQTHIFVMEPDVRRFSAHTAVWRCDSYTRRCFLWCDFKILSFHNIGHTSTVFARLTSQNKLEPKQPRERLAFARFSPLNPRLKPAIAGGASVKRSDIGWQYGNALLVWVPWTAPKILFSCCSFVAIPNPDWQHVLCSRPVTQWKHVCYKSFVHCQWTHLLQTSISSSRYCSCTIRCAYS